MATVDNYKIKINVEGQDQVVDLMDNLNELQTTLNRTATAGIAAFSALATSAVRMADDMIDLAQATGFSAGKIYQLNIALEASGGKFGDAGGLLKGFAKTLGDVEKGTTETLDAFKKLGISTEQLETLSDQQLFQAVIDGLAGMEAGFERNRIAMLLTGKAGDAIDWKKMSDGTRQAVDPELEKRLQLASDAVGQIEESFRVFQRVALDAITPILQGIKDFNITAEGAKTAIQVLGSLIAAAFAASTIIQLAKIVKLIKDLGNVTKAAAAAQAFLVGLSGVGLAAVAAAGVAATAAYVALGKAMESAADEKARLDGDVATPGTPATGAGRTVGQTPEERALAAAKETTRQMREKNAEANRYQQIINNTIGKTEEEANLIKTIADLERSAGNEKLSIQKQIDAELSKGVDTNRAVVVELQKQLTEVDKQLAIQKQLKTEEIQRLQTQKDILNAIELQSIEQQAIFDITKKKFDTSVNYLLAEGKLTERQANIAKKLGESNLKYYTEIQRLQNEYDKALEKSDLDALDRIDVLRHTAGERWRFELEDIAKVEAAETIRTQNYVKGMGDAIEQISKSFEPYKMAQDAILMTWNKIGNAVDEFVQTGKFKFSDFAKSVLRDLAAMIIKAQILFAVKKTLGFFGLSIPGLAEGGPAKAGQPYIVGEKGPELFVPKSAGTVIPNNKLSATTEAAATGKVNAPVTNNYITNNINALDAKSVAQLFAENRKTLLGVTETARREMAYGM